MALEYVGGQTPIHLSCDIDALDPGWAPSAGHLVPGGLSLQEGELVVRRVRDTGNLVAMDLVEVNPTINVEGLERTINSACALIKGAFGLSTETCPYDPNLNPNPMGFGWVLQSRIGSANV